MFFIVAVRRLSDSPTTYLTGSSSPSAFTVIQLLFLSIRMPAILPCFSGSFPDSGATHGDEMPVHSMAAQSAPKYRWPRNMVLSPLNRRAASNPSRPDAVGSLYRECNRYRNVGVALGATQCSRGAESNSPNIAAWRSAQVRTLSSVGKV